LEQTRRITTLLIVLIFVCMFAVGILHYQDYGVSVDEGIQRQHSLVAYKYIMKQVFHRDVAELVSYPDLPEYQYRYYGTFLQMPMVFLEDLNDFQSDLGDVMRMRHLITFSYCFIAYICFYWMGKKVFKNSWLALLGTLMLYLYPRFFATQFFYIKDMLFAATFMIAMWATVLFLEKEEKPLYGLLFCFAAAICANLRFIGMIFPALLIGYLLLRDVLIRQVYRQGAKAILRRIGAYAALGLGFLIVYVAINPTCWEAPIQSIVSTVREFSYYDQWKGSSLFMGREVPWNDVPWSYIPVWLLISLPVWYSLLFFCALVLVALLIILPKRVSNRLDAAQDTNEKPTYFGILLGAPYRYVLFALTLFFCPLLLVIVNHSVLYNDWRQMYFLLVPFVFLVQFVVYAFFRVVKRSWVRYAATAVICGALLVQVGWIVENHPYEHQYLNRFAAPYRSQFCRDATRTSLYNVLNYLLENAEEEPIVLDSSMPDFNNVLLQIPLLTAEEQARFRFEAGGEYQIEDYRYVIGNDASRDGYEEWYTIYVDSSPIASIFRALPNVAD